MVKLPKFSLLLLSHNFPLRRIFPLLIFFPPCPFLPPPFDVCASARPASSKHPFVPADLGAFRIVSLLFCARPVAVCPDRPARRSSALISSVPGPEKPVFVPPLNSLNDPIFFSPAELGWAFPQSSRHSLPFLRPRSSRRPAVGFFFFHRLTLGFRVAISVSFPRRCFNVSLPEHHLDPFVFSHSPRPPGLHTASLGALSLFPPRLFCSLFFFFFGLGFFKPVRLWAGCQLVLWLLVAVFVPFCWVVWGSRLILLNRTSSPWHAGWSFRSPQFPGSVVFADRRLIGPFRAFPGTPFSSPFRSCSQFLCRCSSFPSAFFLWFVIAGPLSHAFSIFNWAPLPSKSETSV